MPNPPTPLPAHRAPQRRLICLGRPRRRACPRSLAVQHAIAEQVLCPAGGRCRALGRCLPSDITPDGQFSQGLRSGKPEAPARGGRGTA
jgi:hypothetical protein